MKAYKGTYDQKCLNFRFEVDKTYTFNGKIELCSQGFHCCLQPKQVISYYPMQEDFQLMEVEVLDSYIPTNDKLVTNKLKIIRIIPKDETEKLLNLSYPIKQYDERHNLIYSKDPYGNEIWNDYDQFNKHISSKDSKGLLFLNIYNEKNQLISIKDAKGQITRKEYDQAGNCIHVKCPDKTEIIYKYDNRNRCTYIKQKTGEENNFEYDENDNVIYKDSSIYDYLQEWRTYDNHHNCIYTKYNNGGEIWREFDENHNCIHQNINNSWEEWTKYNKNNNRIYHKNTSGLQIWNDWDDRNNRLYHKETRDNNVLYEEFYCYNEDNACISFKSLTDSWNISID